MNVREYIQKINNEKQQLIDEIKSLKAEIEELKMINKKLVDDFNSHIEVDADKVIEEVKPEVVEEPEKRNPSDDEDATKPIPEEVGDVVEEDKPKRSRRKKDSEDSVVNLM